VNFFGLLSIVNAISPAAMDEILNMADDKGCGHPEDHKLLDGSGRCGDCYLASQRVPKVVVVTYTYDSTLVYRPAEWTWEMEVPTYATPKEVHGLVIWRDINALQEANFCSWRSEADGLWVLKNRYSTRPTPYQEVAP
jgi:hypothetical protein